MATKADVKRAVILLSKKCGANNVVSHADGTYTVKRGFFYRHGNSANAWAVKVFTAMSIVGTTRQFVEITNRLENWQEWPKDSFFEATLEVVHEDGLVALATAYANSAYNSTLKDAAREAHRNMADR